MQRSIKEKLLKTSDVVTDKAQVRSSVFQLWMLLDRVGLIGTEIMTSVYSEMSWKTPASSLLGTVVIRWW